MWWWILLLFVNVTCDDNFVWTHQNISWSSDRCEPEIEQAFEWWRSNYGAFDFHRGIDYSEIQFTWRNSTKKSKKKLGLARMARRHRPAEIVIFSKANCCDSELCMITIAHEIGHVLGMEHDSYMDSVMYESQFIEKMPRFVPKKERKTLKQFYGCYQDADAIGVIENDRYFAFKGKRHRSFSTRYPIISREARNSNYFPVERVDALYQQSDNDYVVLSGDNYFVMSLNGVVTETGLLLDKYGIYPSEIDAACRFYNQDYIFMGNEVYVGRRWYFLSELFVPVPRHLPLKGAWTSNDNYIMLIDRFDFQHVYNFNFELKKIVNLRRKFPRFLCSRPEMTLPIYRV